MLEPKIPLEKRLITIDKVLARMIDDDIKQIGYGCNFSAWIREASVQLLKIKHGFSYGTRRRSIIDEVVQRDEKRV